MFVAGRVYCFHVVSLSVHYFLVSASYLAKYFYQKAVIAGVYVCVYVRRGGGGGGGGGGWKESNKHCITVCVCVSGGGGGI